MPTRENMFIPLFFSNKSVTNFTKYVDKKCNLPINVNHLIFQNYPQYDEDQFLFVVSFTEKTSIVFREFSM